MEDSSKDEERGDIKQQQQQQQQEEGGKQNEVVKETPKGKSCIGYLYYSSYLKSHNRHPRCIGIPRTLHKAPKYVGQAEVDKFKGGRTLFDFYYACAGYSVYSTNLPHLDKQRAQRDLHLPVCVGLKVLLDINVTNADSSPDPVHTRGHSREDVHGVPRPHVHKKPAPSSGEDFLSRFTRSAGLVASGVARNMRRVGNYLKESLDDIFYPYRKRPK